MQYDFLAVGDITTDAFIKLSDAWIETDNPKREQELCMRFAEKIPYESLTEVSAVGNSANAAVCAARLGLSAGLVSNLGDDKNGAVCVDVLKKEGVGTDYIAVHANTKTNYHFVLWYGADRTILVKHEAYPYALPHITSAPHWLYLSSIGDGTEKYHEEIADWLAKNPSVKFAFQPGTFQLSLGAEKLRALYARAEVLVVNREEAQKIISALSPFSKGGVPESRRGWDEGEGVFLQKQSTPPPRSAQHLPFGKGQEEIKELLAGLHELGPKIVCITDGPNGAYFSDETGNYFMPPYPDPAPPRERTGAGDAFASTFVSYLALGYTPLEALHRAPINSAFVVQEIGAQKGLLSREKLEESLAQAPSNYQPQAI